MKSSEYCSEVGDTAPPWSAAGLASAPHSPPTRDPARHHSPGAGRSRPPGNRAHRPCASAQLDALDFLRPPMTSRQVKIDNRSGVATMVTLTVLLQCTRERSIGV